MNKTRQKIKATMSSPSPNLHLTNANLHKLLLTNRLATKRLKAQNLQLAEGAVVDIQSVVVAEPIPSAAWSSTFVSAENGSMFATVAEIDRQYLEPLHQGPINELDLSGGLYYDYAGDHKEMTGSTHVFRSVNPLEGIVMSYMKEGGVIGTQQLYIEVYDGNTGATPIPGTYTQANVTGQAPDYVAVGRVSYTFTDRITANTPFVIRVWGVGDFTFSRMLVTFHGAVTLSTVEAIPVTTAPLDKKRSPFMSMSTPLNSQAFNSCTISQNLTCLPSARHIVANRVSAQYMDVPVYTGRLGVSSAAPTTLTSLILLSQNSTGGVLDFEQGRMWTVDGFGAPGFVLSDDTMRFRAPYTFRYFVFQWFAPFGPGFPDQTTAGEFTWTVRAADGTTILGEPLTFDVSYNGPIAGFSTLQFFTFPLLSGVNVPYTIGLQSAASINYAMVCCLFGVF